MKYRDKKYELVIILALNGRLLTSLIPLQSSSLFYVRVSDKRLTNTSLKGIFVTSTSRAQFSGLHFGVQLLSFLLPLLTQSIKLTGGLLDNILTPDHSIHSSPVARLDFVLTLSRTEQLLLIAPSRQVEIDEISLYVLGLLHGSGLDVLELDAFAHDSLLQFLLCVLVVLV